MTEQEELKERMKEQAKTLLAEMKDTNPQESHPSFGGKLLEGQQVEFAVLAGKEIVTRPNKFNPDTMQAIVPVIYEGLQHSWWLNVKNPVYREILTHLAEGHAHFKILKTGAGKDTRYALTVA